MESMNSLETAKGKESCSVMQSRWPEYTVEIKPTADDIKEGTRKQWRKQNPHLFAKIDNYLDLWVQNDLKRVTLSDAALLEPHTTCTVYTIPINPDEANQRIKKLQKYVVKTPEHQRCIKPIVGHIVTIAYEPITEQTLQESFEDIVRPLRHSREFLLGKSNGNSQEYEAIVKTMAVGERCIVRQDLTSLQDSNILGIDYEIQIIELIEVWHRIRIPPIVVIDISATTSRPVTDVVDHKMTIHYKLYKRLPREDIDFNPNKDWILVRDTRAEGVPDVVICEDGYELPCLDKALAQLKEKNARGRLLSKSCFAAGPHNIPGMQQALRTVIQLEELDLSKYKKDNLEGYDIMFLDLEIVDVKKPNYLQITGDESEGLTTENKLKAANLLRLRGNEFMARQSYKHAIIRYEKALGFVLPERILDVHTPHAVHRCAEAILLNGALANMKIEEWKTALQCITDVLRLNPENIKGLYRGAICQRHLGNIQDASRMIYQAEYLDPNDRNIKKERRIIKKMDREDEKQQHKMFEGLKKCRGAWGVTESHMESIERNKASSKNSINDCSKGDEILKFVVSLIEGT